MGMNKNKKIYNANGASTLLAEANNPKLSLKQHEHTLGVN